MLRVSSLSKSMYRKDKCYYRKNVAGYFHNIKLVKEQLNTCYCIPFLSDIRNLVTNGDKNNGEGVMVHGCKVGEESQI